MRADLRQECKAFLSLTLWCPGPSFRPFVKQATLLCCPCKWHSIFWCHSLLPSLQNLPILTCVLLSWPLSKQLIYSNLILRLPRKRLRLWGSWVPTCVRRYLRRKVILVLRLPESTAVLMRILLTHHEPHRDVRVSDTAVANENKYYWVETETIFSPLPSEHHCLPITLTTIMADAQK